MANIHTAAFYGRTCANRGTLDPIIGLLHHNNGGRSRRACGSLGTDSRLLRCGVLASTDVRLRVRDAHDPGARFQRRLRARGCGEEGVAGKSAGPTMLVILIGCSPLEIRRLFAELQRQGARGLLSGTRSRLFGARRGSGPAARPCRSGTVSAPIDAEFTVRCPCDGSGRHNRAAPRASTLTVQMRMGEVRRIVNRLHAMDCSKGNE
jgi:hypothetical protein